jgi:uncharacterized damage-inducible protein DinB
MAVLDKLPFLRQQSRKGQVRMKKSLVEDLEKSRQYTLNVAEAMPAEGYDFKPTENVWTFRELMHHIAYCMIWMDANYLRQTKVEWDPTPVQDGKAAVTGYVRKAYDTVASTLVAMHTATPDHVKGFYAILEHTSHHRGQAVTFLRCKGITPPEYPF